MKRNVVGHGFYVHGISNPLIVFEGAREGRPLEIGWQEQQAVTLECLFEAILSLKEDLKEVKAALAKVGAVKKGPEALE